MTFSDTLKDYGGYAGYVIMPENIALHFLNKNQKRVKCIINNGYTLHCALKRNDDLGYFVSMSRRVRKEANIHFGESLTIEVLPDDSEYQVDMPEEFHEVLLSDEEGFEAFQALTPGKQRSIIFHVKRAKRSETRINRALKMIENLKMGMTDLKEIMRR